MVRRISATLIGLALCLPVLAVAPVAAHTTDAFVVAHTTYTEGLNTHVIGTVENHTNVRSRSLRVNLTWTQGSAVIQMVSLPPFLPNLAPHARTPFHITVATADTVPADTLTASAAEADPDRPPGIAPIAALDVQSAVITNGSPDTVTGTVINEGSSNANGVRVYALVFDGSTLLDAGTSNTITTLLPGGAGGAYTIDLTRDVAADDELYMVARTSGGGPATPWSTSWNNFFGDLGNSSFTPEIAWMADQGITTGCATTSFCPKSTVSRANMAVFLDRALGLTDAPGQGFTDLAGLSASVVQSINNIAAAGITGGCDATPKRYCPSDPVTRGQMSKFVVEGYNDEGGKDLDPIAGAGSFTDDDGHFSEAYNNAMADAGITGGCATGMYCPLANVLREQMAVFIFRADALPDEAP